MSFTTLTKPTTDQSTKQSLAAGLIDNLNDLQARLVALEGANLPNGSFEVDGDGDGDPDGWTITDYAGGSHALESSAVAHGGQALKFTRTLGASNGGGYADSPLVPVAPGALSVGLWYAASAALKGQVQLLFYNEDETYLSTTTLATITAATQLRALQFAPTVPGGARFALLRLTGGATDTDVAGTVTFDGVQLTQGPEDYNRPVLPGSSYDDTVLTGSYSELFSFSLFLPATATGLDVTVTVAPGDLAVYVRFKIGTDYSSEEQRITVDGSGAETMTMTGLDTKGHAGSVVTVSVEGKRGSTGGSVTATSDVSDGFEAKISVT